MSGKGQVASDKRCPEPAEGGQVASGK